MKQVHLRQNLISIAESAGREILRVRQSGILDVREKSDQSPSTIADEAAQDEILSGLRKISQLPIVSEEIENPALPMGSEFWLVDPLDGTKDFIRGSDSFCVLIALIRDCRPVIGVMHAPLLGVTAFCERGSGVEVNGRLLTKPSELSPQVAVVSQGFGPRGEKFLKEVLGIESVIKRSSALKFLDIAMGVASVYPRHGNTSEWDTAVGQLFLEELGGFVLDLDNFKPLSYQKPNWLNSGFIASSYPLDLEQIKKGRG